MAGKCNFGTTRLFFRNVFSLLSTKTILAFSRFHYQNFLSKIIVPMFSTCTLVESEKAPCTIEMIINLIAEVKLLKRSHHQHFVHG